MGQQDFQERLKRCASLREEAGQQESWGADHFAQGALHQAYDTPPRKQGLGGVLMTFIICLAGVAGFMFWQSTSNKGQVLAADVQSLSVDVNSAYYVDPASLAPSKPVTGNGGRLKMAIPANWRALTPTEITALSDDLGAAAGGAGARSFGFGTGAGNPRGDFSIIISVEDPSSLPPEQLLQFTESLISGFGQLSALSGGGMEIVQSTVPVDSKIGPAAKATFKSRQELTQMRVIDAGYANLMIITSWPAGAADGASIDAILNTLQLN